MDFDSVALDTCAMAGPLEVRLRAAISRGFNRLVFSAADLVNHPDGVEAAVAMVKRSGVKVQALRQLHDFEGLTGPLHQYKVNVAKGLLTLCQAVAAPVLLVTASTLPAAADDADRVAADLAKLATLAVPKGINIAYQALPGSSVAADVVRAEEWVNAGNRANLGLAIDTAHLFGADDGLDALARLYADKLVLVGLSDTIALSQAEPGSGMADHVRVFPGDGGNRDRLVEMIRRLRLLNFHDGFYLNAANEDYAQLPADFVADRARESLYGLLGLLRHLDLPWHRKSVSTAAMR